MRVGICSVLALLLPVAACAGSPPVAPAPLRQDIAAPAAGGMSQSVVNRDVVRLRAALLREVPQHTTDTADGDRAWIARAKVATDAAPFWIDRAQLIVVVDRNPAVQQLRIVLARPDAPWEMIGGSKVSTGQAGRHGYFITPVGVFLHTDGIVDYRALGTFNENHIRGLGLKGMRVWDFGWQTAARGWHVERDLSEMRLLMHATDPANLEQRLGRPASEGCVRIPATMNRFLDVHGVLDADYERSAGEFAGIRGVLRPDREPSPQAGSALVVVDSSL